ncbi:cytochrome P450 [Tothia fuscella]|uniref:Cytochrome P450 n=1 Tax=Tothia fuscella TaxID=1048955 RepID=A0A9P4NJW6_9PEZI|nr:cytochrome P450 [Tothia fuscella]
MHEQLIELHRRYGPVVRVAPNCYSFNEPEDSKVIYNTTASKTFPKTNFYHTSGDPNRPNVFSMSSEKDHAARKRNLGTVGLFGEYHPLSVRINTMLGTKHVGKVLDDLAERSLNEVGSNIGAGSDTTGITLGAAFYYLYRNPEILATLRQEIDGGPDPISFEETQQMPFLQAVVKETLRIHPAVGYILRRTVPAGGAHLAGRQFPEGTQVGVSAWALHQNENASSIDRATFRPQRWLEGDETNNSKAAMSFARFQFGGGTRICLGRNISLLELYKVIPLVMRNFDLDIQDDDWSLFCTWFVWPDYSVRIRPRAMFEAGST